MTIEISLKDKVAIVTGGRRQLGRAHAIRLAEAGADVAICDIVADDGMIEDTVNEIKKFGVKALGMIADVSKRADVERMISQTVDELGGLDIMVNNAGISSRQTLMNVEDDEWADVMDINLKGLVLCSQLAGKVMIEQGRGGSIINFTSSTGLNANVSRGCYGVSKAGVVMATKLLARELGEHNITVNAIAPGFSSPAKIGGRHGQIFYRGENETEKVFAKLAIKREGEPVDYSNAVIFLASELGSYITGVTIPIDGGFTIR
jgi:NAD(P)-dependent dehydrogenase (short-subunit alcohol dehydrogenase family)